MPNLQGADWQNDIPRGGRHVVTAAEETANAASIATGLVAATVFFVQIFRAGADVTVDAVVTLTAGVLAVADGGATYSVTENDVINWLVV